MSRGTLRSAGYSGVAWGVLTLLAYLSFQLASSTSGGVVLFQVLAPLAVAALAVMMYFLASALTHPMAKIACYVGMAIALLFLLLHFVRCRSACGGGDAERLGGLEGLRHPVDRRRRAQRGRHRRDRLPIHRLRCGHRVVRGDELGR